MFGKCKPHPKIKSVYYILWFYALSLLELGVLFLLVWVWVCGRVSRKLNLGLNYMTHIFLYLVCVLLMARPFQPYRMKLTYSWPLTFFCDNLWLPKPMDMHYNFGSENGMKIRWKNVFSAMPIWLRTRALLTHYWRFSCELFWSFIKLNSCKYLK